MVMDTPDNQDSLPSRSIPTSEPPCVSLAWKAHSSFPTFLPGDSFDIRLIVTLG